MRPDLPWYVTASCVFALTPYALFVFFYAVRSPWFRSMIGRSLMLSKVSGVALLSHLLLVIVMPYPQRFIVWAALFLLLSAEGWFQFIMLRRLQRLADSDATPKRRATDYEEKTP